MISLTIFKAESIFTLCQEFMANINHKPVTEKGKERLISWVNGKKIRVSLIPLLRFLSFRELRIPILSSRMLGCLI